MVAALPRENLGARWGGGVDCRGARRWLFIRESLNGPSLFYQLSTPHFRPLGTPRRVPVVLDGAWISVYAGSI